MTFNVYKFGKGWVCVSSGLSFYGLTRYEAIFYATQFARIVIDSEICEKILKKSVK